MNHPSSAFGTFSPHEGRRTRVVVLLPSAGSLIVIALLLTLSASAELTSSALTGHVTAGHAAAPGVTITATARATQITRTATTNAHGTYWLGALAPGEYDVTFSRAGLTSLTRPATVELGRVARADAKLEPSEDEESITSTAKTVSVANTTAITTHFSREELERVPLRVDISSADVLSPALPGGETLVDDTALFFPTLLGEEALDEVTVIRGAQPIELDRSGNSVILARTRSGSDELFISLRDTYSTRDDGGHVLESASAGRIVPQRLWFFASGWGGDATDVHLHKLRGLAIKLDAQAAAAHHFTATWTDADARISIFDLGMNVTSLRYTGVFDERLTAEAIVSRSLGDSEDVHLREENIAAKVAYRIGDHVVSAGVEESKRRFETIDAVFVSDRWNYDRWTVDAGVRRDDRRTTPRIALAFDLRSETGSHAIVASYGEYLERNRPAQPGPARTPVLRVTSIGYTSSLESSGAARIDLLHYEGARTMDQAQIDARYRLFDRFIAGASYVYTRDHPVLPFELREREHLATAVIGLQLPVGGHELAATALERYDSQTWTTDFGVRYEIPFRRITLTLAGDATNLFDAEVTDDFFASNERGARFWARIRR